MKKIASILLVLVMVLALAAPAFAAGNGSITINNALPGETYRVYKVFDVTYEGTAFSYTISGDSQWYEVVKNYTGLSFDLIAGTTTYNVIADESFDAPAFAEYLNENITGKTATAADTVADNETVASFTGLELGYYFVETTLGSVCFLDTTKPDATITEKHVAPTVEKTVEEDNGNAYGSSNHADFNQDVNFKTEITVQKGTENLVLHDTMGAGFTLKADSIAVVDATAGTDYTLTTTGLSNGCTFEIKFEDSYLSKLSEGTKIQVTYSATLNENAVVADEGNKNSTHITYGAAQESEASETVTRTYGVTLFKYTGTEKTPLAGARFVLYKSVGEAKKYAVVSEGKLTGWVDTEEDATALTSNAAGLIQVDGLDVDSYYFKETAAPNGYNKLKDPVSVSVGDSVARIDVENKTGSELPSTGGIGTTMFYIIGAVLMLGAVVLLVAKKRMASYN